MFNLDDWETVGESVPLPEPQSVALTPARLERFKQAGIATNISIDAHKRGEGWLNQMKCYVFSRAITIEGPSAFYGGPFSPNAWTSDGGLCVMGACSYSHSPLPEGMCIGRYCSIGRDLRFLDFYHPTEWISSSVAFFRPKDVTQLSTLHKLIEYEINVHDFTIERRDFDSKKGLSYPQVGHDVWIGERVTLALGIRIGTGAVIAAGSIVTRDVPPYAVVAGVPATVKKLRFKETLVERLLLSRWWRYSFVDLNKLDVLHPERFLDQLDELKIKSQIIPWQPDTLRLPFDWLREDYA